MSFSTALSGLQAAQTNLDVVSNNIANSNTHGFKRSKVEFADVYAVSQSGGSQNSVGKGVQVTDVKQQFVQGDIELTDNNLDLAITGNGFFRLSDNGTIVYSRAGAFGVDNQGYIVNASNQRLTGFQADVNGTITSAQGDLQVSLGDSIPQATTSLSISANLDATASIPAAFNVNDPLTYNHSASSTIYDTLGESHVSTLYFRKDAVNSWEAFTYIDGALAGGAADTLTFDNLGQLSQINGAAVADITLPAYNPGNGAAPINMTLNLSQFTQFGGGFGLSAIEQDGFPTGRLTGIDVDESGVVLARFSNGRAGPLGQVSLTNFSNVNGLRPEGETAFSETFASGSALTAAPGSTSLGFVQSGAIELSNVDLTRELVNMITAQRSFQANAKVITTSEEISDTVINITR
jgi:flagellar hook protein FlgE